MITASALGTSPLLSPVLPAPAQAGGTAAGARMASAKAPAAVAGAEPAAPAQTSVSLSQQGLATRPDQPENASIDVAQRFIGNVAGTLFGSSAEGASVSVDAGGGAAHAASFDLAESAHFIGRGQVATADGHSFEFEIEVRYQANVQAGEVRARPALPDIATPDAAALAGMQLPEIEFPGSLADLFKVLGRELNIPAPYNPAREDEGTQGQLMLRLQRLVNSAALLAPRARDGSPAQDRSKALASSYGA